MFVFLKRFDGRPVQGHGSVKGQAKLKNLDPSAFGLRKMHDFRISQKQAGEGKKSSYAEPVKVSPDAHS